jgi:hypothetical protein
MVFHPTCLNVVNNTGCLFHQWINEDTENRAIFVHKVGPNFFITPMGTSLNGCPYSFLVDVPSLSLHHQVTALLIILADLVWTLPHHAVCLIYQNNCLMLIHFQYQQC